MDYSSPHARVYRFEAGDKGSIEILMVGGMPNKRNDLRHPITCHEYSHIQDGCRPVGGRKLIWWSW
jgi:hypothetical protein